MFARELDYLQSTAYRAGPLYRWSLRLPARFFALRSSLILMIGDPPPLGKAAREPLLGRFLPGSTHHPLLVRIPEELDRAAVGLR